MLVFGEHKDNILPVHVATASSFHLLKLDPLVFYDLLKMYIFNLYCFCVVLQSFGADCTLEEEGLGEEEDEIDQFNDDTFGAGANGTFYFCYTYIWTFTPQFTQQSLLYHICDPGPQNQS